tara:strand:+ start:435 stop:605 length:171 start_codon:yes stop_codon:yes gene_type:complete
LVDLYIFERTDSANRGGRRRRGMRLGNTLVMGVAAVKYKDWPYNLKPKLSALPFHV